jgi:hypothetical protein
MLDLGKIDELRKERHDLLSHLRRCFDRGLFINWGMSDRVNEIDTELVKLWGKFAMTFGYNYSYGKGSWLR